MKITQVDVIVAKCKTNVTISPWKPVVCRVYTDEGIYGDGEAAVAYETGSLAAFSMIKELAPMIIGKDPLNTEAIWDMMYRNTFWCQNGGPMTFSGMSAIDMALWDIKGKYFNAPLYQLLGGKVREDLRCYASQLQLTGWRKYTDNWEILQEPQEYFDATKRAIEDGYDCVKIDFLCGNYRDEPFTKENRTGLLPAAELHFVEERIAAAREAAGPDVDIIMENHCWLDAQSSVQMGHLAEKYNIFCFEEGPTPSPKMVKYVSDRIKVPQASGERIYSRWQYAPYFEDGSLQMIQPDAGNCGGISEFKKICDMAHAYDISVQAHVCATPLSADVAMHLECSIPNFQIHEHHICHESNRNLEMSIYNNLPVNGRCKPSDRPGIGNEIHPRLWKENLGFASVK